MTSVNRLDCWFGTSVARARDHGEMPCNALALYSALVQVIGVTNILTNVETGNS